MRIACEVINDLLPLYHDGICSDESKVLVDKHIADCKDCRSELDMMNSGFEIDHNSDNLLEVKDLKELSKKWRWDKIKSFLKGTLTTLAIIIIIVLIMHVFA